MAPIAVFHALFFIPIVLLALASLFLACASMLQGFAADDRDARVEDALVLQWALASLDRHEEARVQAVIARHNAHARERRIDREIARTLARHIDRVADPEDLPDFVGFAPKQWTIFDAMPREAKRAA